MVSEPKRFFTATEILNLQNDRPMWLWEGYLPAIGLAGLSGPSDCGKSTLLRQLSMAIAARAATFLDAPLHTRTNKIVYVSTEDGAEGIKLSLEKQAYAQNFTCGDNITFICETENLSTDLQSILGDTKVDMIVLDAWSDLFKGNPNNMVEVREDLKKLKALAFKYHCCVLILHHNVKHSEKSAPDKNKLNGSQAIEAKLRSLIELRMGSTSDTRHITVTKGNYLRADQKNVQRVLKLHNDSLLFEKLQEVPATSRGQFDAAEWMLRLAEVKKEGVSYESAVQMLKEKYPGEQVPSKTWFIDSAKSLVFFAMEGANNS